MPPPPVRLRVDVPALKVKPVPEKDMAGLPLSVTVELLSDIVRVPEPLLTILFPVIENPTVVKLAESRTNSSPLATPTPRVNASPSDTTVPGALMVSPPPIVLPAVISVALPAPPTILNLPVYVYV
jgi:hypothetical protein